MRYDLVIIGGGMVGASLACALADSSLHIALVDAAPLEVKEDARLIALNYGSFRLFQKLGIWNELAPHAAAINQVHVSDRGRFGKTRIKKEDLNLPALGFVVPAKFINTVLSDVLHKQKNVTQFRPAVLKSLIQNELGVTLIIQTGDSHLTLEAARAAGADGTFSTVRKLLEIPVETVDYQQTAIVTVTELQRPHENIAYERFHPSGALAMLPLKGERCATIWSDDNANIGNLMRLDDEAFLAILQQQFGYRLGRLVNISARHTYPLLMVKSSRVVKDHIVLVGNAAHTLHPIAAQGFNLALAEVAMLAQLILEEPLTAWEKYSAWQQKSQTTSVNLSHGLTGLFSQDFFLVNFLRQAGMVGLDICLPLKKFFAKKAMGLSIR